MKWELQHVEVHVSSIAAAREFYVGKLGMEVIDEIPALNLIAVRAGSVRISIFGGFVRDPARMPNSVGTHIILRTTDLERSISDLQSRGLVFADEIVEAPGFMRDIATFDPDGNRIEIAQYLRDPLIPA
jgi:catechol 2,3-dioxygenase-like lactoylglutathione lyase family enzyme